MQKLVKMAAAWLQEVYPAHKVHIIVE